MKKSFYVCLLIILLGVFFIRAMDLFGSKEQIEAAESPHYFTSLCDGLIAHGGGGILEIDGTNCREAIITSYNNGHRVFELDLNLTTDGYLVAVHDWPSYIGPMSKEEWKEVKIADVFESLSLDDIYEMMLEKEDMYIVTDTKSFEYTEEETLNQFRQIYDTALEYDTALLDRVIPQIYNQEMYDQVKSVYPFRSIIYTLYASKDSDAEVIDFVKDKDDIKVITMGPVRYNTAFKKSLDKYNKYIYFFTINDIEEIEAYRRNGIHGFYTDFVYPS